MGRMDSLSKKGFVRINALLWADILVAYALFVMQDYLTDVWKLSFIHAAGIVNIWGGISKVLPVFLLFLVDAFLGNFRMLVVSSISYSLGIGLLTMSTPSVLANLTGTCKQYEPECIGETQKVMFYTGMALIAIGVAGNLVSMKPFREGQNEGTSSSIIDRLKPLGITFIALVPIIGAIALPYIKPWTLRFGIPAICTFVATVLFLTGSCGPWRFKEDEPPKGSPVTNVCRVYVASTYKMCKSYPLNAEGYHRDGNESFRPTRFLRCLEKAAIKSGEDRENNRWKLCSVAEVEEAKIALRMVPMWLTFVVCGIVSSIGNTYFVEQAKKMDRHIGKLKLPPQILLLVFDSAKGLFGKLANWILGKEQPEGSNPNRGRVPEHRTPTTDSSTYQKVAPAFGIGVAMTFSIVCCIVAALVEIRRLKVIRSHGLLDKPDEGIPMNILWLVFQFLLLAGLDSFLENSMTEFYKHQSPPSMQKYLGYFTKGVSGLGFMSSVLCVYVVGKISEKGGKPNWFQYTLNKSHLERYYWVLAGLSAVNLVVFIVVASCYRYKDLEARPDEGDGAGGGELYTEGEYECKCC